MNIQSFREDVQFNEDKIGTKVILESSFSKEIRILLKTGQEMKEHKSAYPILIHILEGKINFGVNGETYVLQAGDIITLESHVPHNLVALDDSMIRLTLSKLDDVKRVSDVANNA